MRPLGIKSKTQYHYPLNYSVVSAILDILIDIGESFPVISRKTLNRWAFGYPKPPRWRLERALKYLEKVGKIDIVEENEKIFIKLTRKGKIQALLERLEKDYKTHGAWDGKWRIVIWDIPEATRRQRNQIRNLFKNLGFLLLQKSVFIAPYPLPASAVEYLKESELIKFVRFLRVDKIDDDKFLRKHFHLRIT